MIDIEIVLRQRLILYTYMWFAVQCALNYLPFANFKFLDCAPKAPFRGASIGFADILVLM